jgi:hypothetical protein
MIEEAIPVAEYRKLANRFTAEKFDAMAICDLAIRAGMKYTHVESNNSVAAAPLKRNGIIL